MSPDATQLVTPVWIRPVLQEFEGRGYFDEMEQCGRIGRAIRDNQPTDSLEIKASGAEFMAFSFQPEDLGVQSCWNTHFGPHFTVGEACEPDIADIDESILGYWRCRMVEATHPILRARYADLLWDLSRSAGAKPPVDAARIAADSYAAFGPLADEHSMIAALDRLQRGLQITLQIKDEQRTECLRAALFELLTRVNHPWGWVNLYDTFEHFDRVRLTEPQRDAITAGLEAHITEVSGRPQGAQPIETLHVAARLARHYHRLGRPDDVGRVMRASGQAVERAAAAANAAVGHAWLDDVYRVYRAHGLDEDATRVLLAARARGTEAERQMVTTSVSCPVEPDQLEAFVNGVTEGGLPMALHRVAGYFLPDLDGLRQQLEGQRHTHPLYSMLSWTHMREGQTVARSGPANIDPEGALIRAVAQDIGLRACFLGCAIDRARERYSITADTLVAFLYESPLFSAKFHGLISQGLEAYLQGDHVKAVHVLVPQIENALRGFLYLLGVPPNKPRRGEAGAMTEKTLTDILEHEPVLRDYFGEGVMLYLLTFLADPRGPNVRNRMSHGLMAAEEFRRQVSDRVLHILLLLGLVRRAEKPNDRPADDSFPQSA